MATAPTPGVGKRQAEVDDAQRRLIIRVKDHPKVDLYPNLVNPMERAIVRKATGNAFTAYYGGEDTFDEDSLAVLWWLARRANGEPLLTWQQVVKEWPSPLRAEDVELIDDTPDAEDDDTAQVDEDATPE